MMGAQPDRPVRQPELRVHRRLARSPRRSCSASAARRATRSTTRRSYWIPNHSPQRVRRRRSTSCRGVGYDRAAELGAGGARFHEIRRVVTNLGVLDFETPDHRMRLRSVHPGVTVDEVVAATGFELVDRRRRARDARCRPTRSCADPRGHRPRRPRATEGGARSRDAPALHTPLCDLLRHRVPDRADRHGLGRRRPARRRRPRDAGGLGILAVGDDDLRRSCAARSARSRTRTDKPVRREPARRRRPTSTTASTLLDRRGREGRVASRRRPSERLIEAAARTRGVRRRCRRSAPSATPRRCAAWGVDAVHRAGRRGRRPHRLGARPRCCCRRSSTRSTSR